MKRAAGVTAVRSINSYIRQRSVETSDTNCPTAILFRGFRQIAKIRVEHRIQPGTRVRAHRHRQYRFGASIHAAHHAVGVNGQDALIGSSQDPFIAMKLHDPTSCWPAIISFSMRRAASSTKSVAKCTESTPTPDTSRTPASTPSGPHDRRARTEKVFEFQEEVLIARYGGGSAAREGAARGAVVPSADSTMLRPGSMSGFSLRGAEFASATV